MVTIAALDASTVGLALAVAWACATAAVTSDLLRRSAHRRPERTAGGAATRVSRTTGSKAASGAVPGSTATSGTSTHRSAATSRSGTGDSTAISGPDRESPTAPVVIGGRRSDGGTSPASRVNRAVASLGRVLRRLVGQTVPVSPESPDAGPSAADREAADRRTGWAALASGALLVVAPALAAAPVTWAVAVPVISARRRAARRDAALVDQLPDVVDLLGLTAAAGLPVAAALGAIGARPGGPIGEALARAAAHVRHGGSTGDALARLAEAGPAVRQLADALVQHDRYGTPLLPALQRVGIEARARRRRAAEEAARRLPVTLLFPLVLTTFPAFVLLTVVPLLAGSLGSLSPTSV